MKSFHIICIIILVQLRSFGIHEHSQRRYIFLNILDTFPFAHDISYSVYYMVWNFIALRVIFCRHLSDAVIMQMVATCLYIFHKEGADAIRIKCSFYCMLKISTLSLSLRKNYFPKNMHSTNAHKWGIYILIRYG